MIEICFAHLEGGVAPAEVIPIAGEAYGRRCPEPVSDAFPDGSSRSALNSLRSLASGFQGGIRDVPTREEDLRILFAFRKDTVIRGSRKSGRN